MTAVIIMSGFKVALTTHQAGGWIGSPGVFMGGNLHTVYGRSSQLVTHFSP